MLRWDYLSAEHQCAGAIAPMPLDLPFGRQRAQSPMRVKDYTERWRRLEAGERVQPGDCRPVRILAHYGFVVACPGHVLFRRRFPPHDGRSFGPDWACFGEIEVGGDPWPESDSLRVASWIAGSAYVKVQTGIVIYYPADTGLYQGPLPNDTLQDKPFNKLVMAGIETVIANRTVTLDGQAFGVAELNVIFSLPGPSETIEIARGTPVGWFFAVPGPKQLGLDNASRRGKGFRSSLKPPSFSDG